MNNEGLSAIILALETWVKKRPVAYLASRERLSTNWRAKLPEGQKGFLASLNEYKNHLDKGITEALKKEN